MPIAQLDRASDYGSEGCRFNSYWAHFSLLKIGYRGIINLMWKKITSISLSMFLLVSVNFCLAECACAASEHHHGEEAPGVPGHHDKSSDEDCHGSGSEKHDDGSLCCSSLVADQIPSGSFFDSKLLKNQVLANFITVDPLFVASLFNHPQYRAEFPPGTSPPAVFLSTYFTHAPPVIL